MSELSEVAVLRNHKPPDLKKVAEQRERGRERGFSRARQGGSKRPREASSDT